MRLEIIKKLTIAGSSKYKKAVATTSLVIYKGIPGNEYISFNGVFNPGELVKNKRGRGSIGGEQGSRPLRRLALQNPNKNIIGVWYRQHIAPTKEIKQAFAGNDGGR